MADRLPFYFFNQCYCRDWNVSKHEDREGKCIQDLLRKREGDLFPFADHGNSAVDQQTSVEHNDSSCKEGNVLSCDHLCYVTRFGHIGKCHA